VSDYTAKDIHILTNHEASEKFLFVRVKELSERYTSTSTEFIERLLESCALSGFDEQLAIQRYLEKDRSIQPTPELIECHKELMDRCRIPIRT
jgi:hemerythrin superfamily protein